MARWPSERYNGTGCRAAARRLGHRTTCLTCNLKRCVEDARDELAERNQQIFEVRQMHQSGKGPKAIACEIGRSVHTVKNWLYGQR